MNAGKQDQGIDPGSVAASEYVAASSELERRLVAMWGTLLGIERVGVETSFFEMGGTSLLMKELLVRLNDQMQANLLISELFRYPTIRMLADRLAGPADTPASVGSIRSQGNRRREALLARKQPAGN